MPIAPIGTVIHMSGDASGSWLKINHRTDVPTALMVRHFQNASEALRLLRLVLPHIPPTSIDGSKAMIRPVSECYLIDAVRELIAADMESNSLIGGTPPIAAIDGSRPNTINTETL